MERRCELCGRRIPKERLQALPETKRCVDCSRKNGPDIRGRRIAVRDGRRYLQGSPRRHPQLMPAASGEQSGENAAHRRALEHQDTRG